ncbi:MAG: hypothetical protein FWD44_08105 [Oscillospiraceae bacterium]|nr:hypothetical protein [Oscillospiraceae bacterium]
MRKTVYKKITAITLSLIMVLMLLAACGAQEVSPKEDPTPPLETVKPPDPTPGVTPPADDDKQWLVEPYEFIWSMSIVDVEIMIKKLQDINLEERSPAEQRTLLLLEFYYDWYTTPPTHHDRPEPSYLEEHPLNTQVEVDLTGDGKKDKITVNITQIDEWSQQLTLIVNDIEFELIPDNGIFAFYPADGFAIVDIDTSDNYLEIAISDYGPSNDERTFFFRFDGEKIIYMGVIEELYSDIEFLGNGELLTVGRAGILQTWFFPRRYEVNDENLLMPVAEDLYFPRHADKKYFALKDLQLYTQRDTSSPTILMEQTSIVTLTAHDCIEWVQVTLADGQIGWFRVKDYIIIETADGDIDAMEALFVLSFAD